MQRPASPRTRDRRDFRHGGFTLIELVVTLTLVSVLAMVAVPLYEVTMTRNKESELRTALRQIRSALDEYKSAADAGIIAKQAGTAGYPPDLQTLVVGVDTIASNSSLLGPGAAGNQQGAPGMAGQTPASSFQQPSFFPPTGSGNGANGAPGAANGSGGAANAAAANAIPSHLVFLRSLPRDPFTPDPTIAPEQQWNLRAFGAQPGDFSGGSDVYDVSSKSTATGLNGIAYKDW